MTAINILKMLDDNIESEIQDLELEALALTEQLAKIELQITQLRSIQRLSLVTKNVKHFNQEGPTERNSGSTVIDNR